MQLSTIDLSKIVTSHPGGYQDIIDALRRHGVDLICYTKMRPIAGPGNRLESLDMTITCDDILTEIEQATGESYRTGMVARAIQRVLAKYDLPCPGQKEWLQPAEFWLTRGKRK